MVVYKCKCGEGLEISGWTEIVSSAKKQWKKYHNRTHPDGSLNVGHGWMRIVVAKR
jgi:hypothetical protein